DGRHSLAGAPVADIDREPLRPLVEGAEGRARLVGDDDLGPLYRSQRITVSVCTGGAFSCPPMLMSCLSPKVRGASRAAAHLMALSCTAATCGSVIALPPRSAINTARSAMVCACRSLARLYISENSGWCSIQR